MDTARRPESRRRTSHAWLDAARRAASAISSAARFDARRAAATVRRHQPGDAASCSREVAAGHGGRRRRRGRGGAQGAAGMGGAVRPRARAAISTRSPAHVQKRERFFAVLETIDNGKPIRETPRHRHAAGRPAFLSPRRLGAAARAASSPATRAGRRLRPDHPVELPAADAGLEDRAGAGRRQHGGAEAGRVHAADRARSSPRSAREAGLPAGVVNIVTGDGDDRRGASSTHAGVDKIAFTGSTEVGRIIRKATAGSGKKLSLELGGKSPFIVFEDADLDSAVEGVVDAIWFNQGQVCCAGSRLLVQEGIADALHRQAQARAWRRCASAIPLDKAVDIGAIVAPVQLERIRGLVDAGRDGRRDAAGSRRARCPTDGCFYPPTLVTDVAAGVDRRAGGDLRPGAGRDDLPHARRGGRARQQHAATASPPRVWTREHQPRARHRAAASRPASSGSTRTNLFDAAAGFGGYRESGFGREGGREGMCEYLTPTCAKSSRSRRRPQAVDAAPAVDAGAGATACRHRPHRQAVHRRQAGAARFRLLATPSSTPTASSSARSALGNRKDIRNAVEAARKARRLGRGDRAQPRAGALLRRREPRRARRRVRATRSARMTGAGAEARRRKSTPSIARAVLLRRAGPTSTTARCTRRRSRGVTLAMNEPIGVIGIVCPDEAPLLGFVSLVAPAIAHGQTRRRGPVASASAARDRLLSGARHVGRARRRRQHRHRRRATSWPRRWPSTTTSTRSGTSADADGRAAGRGGVGRQPEARPGRRRQRRRLVARAEGEGASSCARPPR